MMTSMKAHLACCIILAAIHQGGGLKIMTKGHRYIYELGESPELPCTISGHGYNPFLHTVTWYKLDGGKEYQINTIASINKPFIDTERYAIKPNQTDQNTVHMTLSITNVTLAENGSYRCELKNINTHIGSITHILTVPAALSSFKFDSNNTRESNHSGLTFEFEEKIPYQVSCTAHGGNPMPSLRISLGKIDVSDLFTQTVEEVKSGEPGLTVSHYTVKFVKTDFVAQEEHRGENLKCVAKFHRYTKLKQAKTAAIEVKYAPRFLCKATRTAWPDERNFEIDCTLRSNPPVDIKSILWVIGETGLNLTVGDSKQGYTANATVDYSSGELKVSLMIANVTNVTYQIYHLTARNDIMEKTYGIELIEAYTTQEPTTVEMTTPSTKPTFFQGDVVIAQKKDSRRPVSASSSPSDRVAYSGVVLLAAISGYLIKYH